MKITVIGSGYVGLVTGACLADLGNYVYCLDLNQDKIDLLNQGEIPIYEPGLKELITLNKKEGRLKFGTDIKEATAFGDIQFIAVGTPPDENGSADLSYVLSAAEKIGKYMNRFKVIVNKSTVPVGTADKVHQVISAELAKRDLPIENFSVVSNPEFLKEGAAIDDFMRPDRIVVGTRDDAAGIAAREQMKKLYSPFNRNHERTYYMDTRSSELTKYAANAMLATRISFMNEIANVCDRFGINVEDVRVGMGTDSRIGPAFLRPGCGYGGSCFPKDVQALVRIAQSVGVDPIVLNGVETRNKKQKQYLFEQIVAKMGKDLTGRHICVWGLAFKPDTDDMREASSIDLIRVLCAAGATVTGATVHLVDEGVDTGPVLRQKEIAIPAGISEAELHSMIKEVEKSQLVEVVRDIAEGKLKLSEVAK